jgi:hypothetical protein
VVARARSSSRVVPTDGARLTPGERLRLGAEILESYVAVRWWCARLSLSETLAAVRNDRGPACDSRPEASVPGAIRLGAAVQKTLGALPFDSRCLIRSLVLTRLLTRRGLDCSLVIGVSSEPRFAAHAWVEHAGVPLLPTGTRFHRLTEF